MLSKKLESFERAFDTLNEHYFDGMLSKSVVTITPTPGAYGHYTPRKVWVSGEESYHEINLGAEDINRPIEHVIATMVHEMVHQFCDEQGIKDTSRKGVYHNRRFREEATKRGLLIERDATHGWTITEPAESLRLLVAGGVFEQVEADLHRLGSASSRKGGAKNSSDAADAPKRWHRYTCPECGRWVRARDEMRVICMDCDCEMIE